MILATNNARKDVDGWCEPQCKGGCCVFFHLVGVGIVAVSIVVVVVVVVVSELARKPWFMATE